MPTPPILRGLKILELMQWGKRFAARELADTLGVDERTIQRDLKTLGEAGFNIESSRGPDGCHHLAEGGRMRPLLLDASETRLILTALHVLTIAATSEAPEFRQILQLRDRFEDLLPEETRREVEHKNRALERRLRMGAALLKAYEKKRSA